MRQDDKAKLWGYGVFFVIIGIGAFSFIYRNSVPLIVILAIPVLLILIQQFLVLPKIHSMYCDLHEVESGEVARFIPILNILDIFPKRYGLAYQITLWAMVPSVLYLLSNYISNGSVGMLLADIVGSDSGTVVTFYLIVILFFVFFVNQVVLGAGLCSVMGYVRYEHKKYFQTKLQKPYQAYEGAYYIFMFVPLFRIFGLVSTMLMLSKLTIMNDLDDIENDYREVTSEQ